MVRRLTEGRLSSEKALNMARAPRLRALPLVGILDTFNDEIQTSARRKTSELGHHTKTIIKRESMLRQSPVELDPSNPCDPHFIQGRDPRANVI